MRSLSAVLRALFPFGATAGQTVLGSRTTTRPIGRSDAAKGSELRHRLDDIQRLIHAGRLDAATAAGRELRNDFERLFDPSKPHYAFASREEREEYLPTASSDFEWIDWGYAECLMLQAYIQAEIRDLPGAVEILTAAREVAPTQVSILTELAYALLQSRQPEAALKTYKEALALSRKFESQRPLEPRALRGIGAALVEMGRLDEAEAALRESQTIEPDSEVARHELEYIRQIRSRSPF
ncbi:hypothetical protein AGMMS50256_14820 [Betaproteobacteria bacterium]|nr:hypothetical protein AGMMS50256_14820 [Betaproteobacteria bacterium]